MAKKGGTAKNKFVDAVDVDDLNDALDIINEKKLDVVAIVPNVDPIRGSDWLRIFFKPNHKIKEVV